MSIIKLLSFLREPMPVIYDVQQYFENAMTSFSTKPPVINNPFSNTDLDGIDSEYDLLSHLLNESDGVCIGEVHNDKFSKKILIDNMAELKEKGVNTIYLEHLFGEEHQKLLDQFYESSSNEMPLKLKKHLKNLDYGQIWDDDIRKKYGFTALVKAAKKYGIRIHAIDEENLYKTGGDGLYVSNNEQRIAGLNYFASEEINRHRQEIAGEGRYIVFVGSAHVGLDFHNNEYIHGIDNLLNIPSIVFNSRDKDEKAQILAAPNLLYSSFRGNFCVERENPNREDEVDLLFSLMNSTSQHIYIQSIISKLHLKGIFIHDLRREGQSLSDLTTDSLYLDILTALEQTDNEKRSNEPDFLKKIIIAIDRENCSLLPGFFDSLGTMPIQQLTFLGELNDDILLDLLKALKVNESVRKLIINHRPLSDEVVKAACNLMRQTQGRIEIASVYKSTSFGKLLAETYQDIILLEETKQRQDSELLGDDKNRTVLLTKESDIGSEVQVCFWDETENKFIYLKFDPNDNPQLKRQDGKTLLIEDVQKLMNREPVTRSSENTIVPVFDDKGRYLNQPIDQLLKNHLTNLDLQAKKQFDDLAQELASLQFGDDNSKINSYISEMRKQFANDPSGILNAMQAEKQFNDFAEQLKALKFGDADVKIDNYIKKMEGQFANHPSRTLKAMKEMVNELKEDNDKLKLIVKQYRDKAGLFTIGMYSKADRIEKALRETPLKERNKHHLRLAGSKVMKALASHRHFLGHVYLKQNNKVDVDKAAKGLKDFKEKCKEVTNPEASNNPDSTTPGKNS